MILRLRCTCSRNLFEVFPDPTQRRALRLAYRARPNVEWRPSRPEPGDNEPGRPGLQRWLPATDDRAEGREMTHNLRCRCGESWRLAERRLERQWHETRDAQPAVSRPSVVYAVLGRDA